MANLVTRSITVDNDKSSVYKIWANFENFPHFMENIESVQRTGDRMSHWKMSGPLGFTAEWDVETVTMEPNERIAWRSVTDSPVKTSGEVHFNQLADGRTEVTVAMTYEPPAGIAGEIVTSVFGNPEGKLEEDLRNFREFAETNQPTPTA
jgi:uncharacterized membrane protein